ncbi:MAG: energy-coupling factor ABC transporter permease [Lachnospiraceae bacterium]|nr:energy-coupling factor ABC transporter permease [Lachnospiraceae bacterium]
MHMADALIAPAVAGTMYACSTGAAGYSIYKMKQSEELKKIPVMGVMGAFVFAAQMINFTIPGTGSSGHLAGGMLLSAVLGPFAGFITMIGVLLIQCLLFADGGLLALGANIWNMAFYGCFIGSFFIWLPAMRHGVTRRKITIASIVGCVLTLQMGAFSVVLETTVSGITELPFSAFVLAMQPIHLAIGLVEGVITAAVLNFVYEARPELLWTGYDAGTVEGLDHRKAKLSYGKTVGVLAVLAALVGGVLSLFASAFPDGLEWSISRLTGSTELESSGAIYQTTARIQEATALLPDYAFPHSDSIAGTSFSGILGGVVVIAFCMVVCQIIRYAQRKRRAK